MLLVGPRSPRSLVFLEPGTCLRHPLTVVVLGGGLGPIADFASCARDYFTLSIFAPNAVASPRVRQLNPP
jgi:hypothetical protein